MTSKVQPAENYWTDDVKMTSKVQPAADCETVDQENLGTRLCYFGKRKNKERNGETPSRTGKYFEWIIKQLLNSAFVGYEEFCRSRGCYPPVDKQNSWYPTQPHSIIAKYLFIYPGEPAYNRENGFLVSFSRLHVHVLFFSPSSEKCSMLQSEYDELETEHERLTARHSKLIQDIDNKEAHWKDR